MSDEVDVEALTKQRNLMALGAVLVSFSSGMQLAGLFAPGNLPWWFGPALAVGLVVNAIYLTGKISQAS